MALKEEEVHDLEDDSHLSPSDIEEYFDSYKIVDTITVYLNCITLFVEFVYLYVVVVNWCLRPRRLTSVFFILFSLRVLFDFVQRAVQVLMDLAGEAFDLDDTLFDGADYLFFAFFINFDVLCHLLICVNRFTAMVYPLQYSTVWTTTHNVVSVVALFVLTVVCVYPSYLAVLPFNIVRIVVSLVSFMLVFIPISKLLFKPTAQAGSHQSKTVTYNIQLLYESVLTAFVKIIENGAFIVLEIQMKQELPSEAGVVVYYVYVLICNVFMAVAISFLFYISTVARKGLQAAFKFPGCMSQPSDKLFTVVRHMTSSDRL